jgi:hypothetical protein
LALRVCCLVIGSALWREPPGAARYAFEAIGAGAPRSGGAPRECERSVRRLAARALGWRRLAERAPANLSKIFRQLNDLRANGSTELPQPIGGLERKQTDSHGQVLQTEKCYQISFIPPGSDGVHVEQCLERAHEH